jgi:N-acetyl-gamma-glutamyl-phosphate reductase
MSAKIFIDGEAGTTGLQIRARLEGRDDVDLIGLADADRKNTDQRRQMLNGCDIAILCLPDDAAREALTLIDNTNTRVIDASTAHRIVEGWVYGMPEMDAEQANQIAVATRVSNPGCYAIASVGLLRPLVAGGLLPDDWAVTINAISGYSGGGKALITEFENASAPNYTEAPYFVYGLGLDHKHVPEIEMWSGLHIRPLFVPSVGRFAQGMIVQVPLQLGALPGSPSAAQLHAVLSDHYAGRRFVKVAPMEVTSRLNRLEPEALNGTNELRLHVIVNEHYGQAILVAVLDNLGKGASGLAVQNLNIMLGLPEETGLEEKFSMPAIISGSS